MLTSLNRFFDSAPAKLLLPLLLPLFGFLLSWAKDRGARAKRLNILEECRKRVEFWEAWTKAVPPEATLPPGLKAQASLQMVAAAEIASATYRDVAQPWTVPPSQYDAHRRRHGAFRRFFLLYEQPTEPLRRRRFVFWILLAEFVLLSLECLQLGFALYIKHRHVQRPGGVATLLLSWVVVTGLLLFVRALITKDQTKLIAGGDPRTSGEAAAPQPPQPPQPPANA